jgi:hypothetical protein
MWLKLELLDEVSGARMHHARGSRED